MVNILLVEDDNNIVRHLSEFLSSEGYSVSSVSGQKDALKKISENSYDLILLDVSLSDGNGFAVCSAVKQTTTTPVIFLTASGDEFSVVTGIDMGADDYISKPFRPRELVSRIKNVLRRSGGNNTILRQDNIKIDTVKGVAYKNDKELFLSALEYRLLLVFFNNIGTVMSRSRLLQEIWDIAGEFVNDNTLTVYIKRLRDKTEDDPQSPTFIKTVRGLGYKIGD